MNPLSKIAHDLKLDINRATKLDRQDVVKFFTVIFDDIAQAEYEIMDLVSQTPNYNDKNFKKETEMKREKIEEILERVQKKLHNYQVHSQKFKQSWVEQSYSRIGQSFESISSSLHSNWEAFLDEISSPFKKNNHKNKYQEVEVEYVDEEPSSWKNEMNNAWNTIKDKTKYFVGETSEDHDQDYDQERYKYAKFQSERAASKAYDDAIKSAGHAKAAASETIEAAKEKAKEAAYRAYYQAMSSGDYLKQKTYENYEDVKDGLSNKWTEYSDYAQDLWQSGQDKVFQGSRNIKEKVQQGGQIIKEQLYQTQDQPSHNYGYQHQSNYNYNYDTPKLDTSSAYGHYHQTQHRSHIKTPVSAFYAALYALYFINLLRKIWNARKASGVYTGDGTSQLQILELENTFRPLDEKMSDVNIAGRDATTAIQFRLGKLLELNQSVSALNWFIASVPLMMILMTLLEINGIGKSWLHAFFVTLSSLLVMRNETLMKGDSSTYQAWTDIIEGLLWGLFGVVGATNLYYSLTGGLSIFH